MGNYVIKLSKEGKDVRFADYNELIFTSELPLLKVHKKGLISIDYRTPQTFAERIVSVKHGLGYKPMFIAYTQYYTSDLSPTFKSEYKQMSWSNYIGSGNFDKYLAYTDSSHLHFDIVIPTIPVTRKTFNLFYFIFEDPIT